MMMSKKIRLLSILLVLLVVSRHASASGQICLAHIEVDLASVKLCSVAKVKFKAGVPWAFNQLHTIHKKRKSWCKTFTPTKSLIVSKSNDRFILLSLVSKKTKELYFFMLYRSLNNPQNITLLPVGIPRESKRYFYLDLESIDRECKQVVYSSDLVVVGDSNEYLSLRLRFNDNDEMVCDLHPYNSSDDSSLSKIYETGIISDDE